MKIELDGKNYFVSPNDCDVSGKWVDNGIGSYEFWGFCGTDRRMEFEISDVKIHSAEDDEGDPVDEPAILQALEEAVMVSDSEDQEEWAEQASNYTVD